ncbi:DUF6538 domain-containing protein [Variovorax sp. J31P207]|uniref:DUF6538 domain-containing protein n=1 Tax=Variovorax sp. J31P207 TaxID=3053510 RepID=UPI0025761C61|nr:DUF6538 domain-containing protein [Variovorax sp. J31P207]MDM0069744.1 hypothetical protein [Variovorax sp. J31P207]
MQNLFRRPSGVYVIRLTVPERLRSTVGKREFVSSTGTRDLAVAKILAATQLAQWRQQFFDLGRLAQNQLPMDYESILTIRDGHPALASTGYLSLDLAAAGSGINVQLLLRVVSDGRLRLFHRPSAKRRVESGMLALPADGAQAVASCFLAGIDEAEVVAFDADEVGVVFVPDDLVRVTRSSVELATVEVDTLRRSMHARTTPASSIRRAL